jgi:DNA-binding transcriptional LysR family regulator
MDKLRALQYFVASAEEGSLAGAGRRLSVTVPAVQKLVNALEASLGVRLFERNAQGLQLTASGEQYLESCRPLLTELESIDELITRSERRAAGTLVIGTHAQIAQHVLLPALPAWHQRHPELQIDLRIVGRVSEPEAAAVEVFVLPGWPDAEDLVHKRVGQTRSFVAASPIYWRRHGLPQHPKDLAQHNCLILRNPNGTLIDLWEFEREGEKSAVAVNGWLTSNARDVLLDAVLAGEGVGRFTQITTGQYLQSGRLAQALMDWEVLGAPPMNLLYRPALRRSPRVRLFLDFVTALMEDSSTNAAGSNATPERPHWHRRGMGRASAVRRGD